MRFLHTADWHIGANRRLLPTQYLDRQMSVIEEMYDIAEQVTDGRIIVAGDIFDRKDVKEVERNRLLSLIERKDREGFRSIIINGNHDILETDRTSLTPFLIVRRRLTNTIVASCRPQVVDLDGVQVVLYPPRDRHCLDNAEAHKVLGEYLKSQGVQDGILVTHLAVAGAYTETGYRLPENGVALRSDRIRYWCLGDIHRAQTAGRDNAWYSGNPCHHRWGENSEKGCLVVDMEKPTSPEFHRLSASPLLDVHEVTEQPPVAGAFGRLKAPFDQIPADLPAWIIETQATASVSEAVLQELVDQPTEEVNGGPILEDVRSRLAAHGVASESDVKWVLAQLEREARTL